MANSMFFRASAFRRLILAVILLLPPVALLIGIAAFKLSKIRTTSDAIVVAALEVGLCVVALFWSRMLSEKVELTDTSIVLSDFLGSRELPFQSLYKIERGYWGRGNCCVSVIEARMKVVKGGRLFSGMMIDEIVRQVSIRAEDLVW